MFLVEEQKFFCARTNVCSVQTDFQPSFSQIDCCKTQLEANKESKSTTPLQREGKGEREIA
jgi:hypothetical protein